jgi:hypothetical protein
MVGGFLFVHEFLMPMKGKNHHEPSPEEIADTEQRISQQPTSVSPAGDSGKQSGLRGQNVAGDAGEGNPAARTPSKSE